MNIKELRIGDIVTTNGIPSGTKRGDYYKVLSVCIEEEYENHEGIVDLEDINDRLHYMGGAWIESIEPIPITDELLEKIGIKFMLRNNTSRVYMIEFCSVQKIVNTDYYTFIAEAGRKNIRTSKHVKYLHELQHELFDAGIDFEIKLM